MVVEADPTEGIDGNGNTAGVGQGEPGCMASQVEARVDGEFSVEHKPIAEEEVWVMLFEPAATKHTGDVETEIRKLSEVEIAIVEPFLDGLMHQLESAWHNMLDVNVILDRYESNPEYVQAAPQDAPMIV